MKRNGYEININISPLPRNCYECPYYYSEWTDCMNGSSGCRLTTAFDFWNCANERASTCPLIGTNKAYEPPTEKQIKYAEQISDELEIPLKIAFTKQSYWEFIQKHKEEYEKYGKYKQYRKHKR